ncbi:MAG: hypothetical protein IKO01_01635 [Kiritimatiellae bacterium]|nr:hypothetical protein [Kiritimatiellia bacterium]
MATPPPAGKQIIAPAASPVRHDPPPRHPTASFPTIGKKKVPMVGKPAPIFPMIGKLFSNAWKIPPIFSNDWKNFSAFFQ